MSWQDDTESCLHLSCVWKDFAIFSAWNSFPSLHPHDKVCVNTKLIIFCSASLLNRFSLKSFEKKTYTLETWIFDEVPTTINKSAFMCESLMWSCENWWWWKFISLSFSCSVCSLIDKQIKKKKIDKYKWNLYKAQRWHLISQLKKSITKLLRVLTWITIIEHPTDKAISTALTSLSWWVPTPHPLCLCNELLCFYYARKNLKGGSRFLILI